MSPRRGAPRCPLVVTAPSLFHQFPLKTCRIKPWTCFLRRKCAHTRIPAVVMMLSDIQECLLMNKSFIQTRNEKKKKSDKESTEHTGICINIYHQSNTETTHQRTKNRATSPNKQQHKEKNKNNAEWNNSNTINVCLCCAGFLFFCFLFF